jgi:hypothetical protein
MRKLVAVTTQTLRGSHLRLLTGAEATLLGWVKLCSVVG